MSPRRRAFLLIAFDRRPLIASFHAFGLFHPPSLSVCLLLARLQVAGSFADAIELHARCVKILEAAERPTSPQLAEGGEPEAGAETGGEVQKPVEGKAETAVGEPSEGLALASFNLARYSLLKKKKK